LVTLAQKIVQDLDSSDALHGLVHRMHAIESLGFVFQLLEQYMDVIAQLLPATPATTKRVHQFRTYVDAIGRELQTYLYGCCAPILLPKEAFLSKLNQCRWDIKDLQTKYNAYVDTIMNSQSHKQAPVP
jgi:predicted transcriptional regulator